MHERREGREGMIENGEQGVWQEGASGRFIG